MCECKWFKEKRKKEIRRVDLCLKWTRKTSDKEKPCAWMRERKHVCMHSVKMWQDENKGPCIGGGVEWMVINNNVQTFESYEMYPSLKCSALDLPFYASPLYNHRPPPVIAVMNRGPAGLSIIFCTV